MSLYSDCHPVLLIRYKVLSSEDDEESEPNLQHSSCRDSKKNVCINVSVTVIVTKRFHRF